MITITILGSGKVSRQLVLNILGNENLFLQQIYARNSSNLIDLVNQDLIVSDISKLTASDVFIIAVSDDAIEEVSNEILVPNQFVLHTSGTASIDLLSKHTRRGVFYMLQTFSNGKDVNFKEIPFCLEAANSIDFDLIEKVAVTFSDHVYQIDSNQRKALHLAAVFANNFTNHLYALAEDICKEYTVPFEILKPLILETSNKIKHLSPRAAQTGPAIRGDQTTIAKHLELLQDVDKKQLYTLITNSIQKNNVKTL